MIQDKVPIISNDDPLAGGCCIYPYTVRVEYPPYIDLSTINKHWNSFDYKLYDWCDDAFPFLISFGNGKLKPWSRAGSSVKYSNVAFIRAVDAAYFKIIWG